MAHERRYTALSNERLRALVGLVQPLVEHNGPALVAFNDLASAALDLATWRDQVAEVMAVAVTLERALPVDSFGAPYCPWCPWEEEGNLAEHGADCPITRMKALIAEARG